MNKSVTVELGQVQEIAISSKSKDLQWLSKISFEGEFSVGDVARILNMVRQGKVIQVSFISPQAEMDLDVREVSVKTGELVFPKSEG
jgi:adenylylsulfate kinase-like enzyme